MSIQSIQFGLEAIKPITQQPQPSVNNGSNGKGVAFGYQWWPLRKHWYRYGKGYSSAYKRHLEVRRGNGQL